MALKRVVEFVGQTIKNVASGGLSQDDIIQALWTKAKSINKWGTIYFGNSGHETYQSLFNWIYQRVVVALCSKIKDLRRPITAEPRDSTTVSTKKWLLRFLKNALFVEQGYIRMKVFPEQSLTLNLLVLGFAEN